MLARVEKPLSLLFGGRENPLHHLGALSIYFFYIALVTGIYLFLFYRTSVDGAWASIEYLSREQWYVGGIMRSLHRYASDAAVITMGLHLVRELARVRMKGPRWFSWFTGMPLIWIVAVFGISGYWMVWDELAQYVATGTAQLLDWLPIFTDPMSRNFLSNDSVSNRLFTLIAFIHLVGLPIVLVLGIWFHLLRVRLPRINPPRRLMAGALGALLALSMAMPVLSHAPANLDRAVAVVQVDWFYLAVFPLMSFTSAGLVWALSVGSTLLLAVLPWLPPARRAPVAEVDLANCNGCGLCAADCPYGAIDMVPRSDGRKFEFEARVNSALCVSCGICTGACPSSSPFRRQVPLLSGIELPNFPIETLRADIDRGRAQAAGSVMVFACAHGAAADRARSPQVHTMILPCVGMVPPAGIDYALRSAGYSGVVISGCEECNCHHRLGDEWTRERIERVRQPPLRRRVPRERILTLWLNAGDEPLLARQVEIFRDRLGEDTGAVQTPEFAPAARKAAP